MTSLAAEHRWCLTGTPIQNSLDDLGALVSFLQVPLLKESRTYQNFIIKRAATNSRNRFENLQTLLGSICLRRTRELLGMPNPDPEIREVTFSPDERNEYDNLLKECRMRIDMNVSGHGKGRDFSVIQSLLQLRLYCNNGNVLRNSSHTQMDQDEVLSFLQQNDQASCVYCSCTIFSINDLPGVDGGRLLPGCSHLVCQECDTQHDTGGRQCPQCSSGARDTSVQDILRGQQYLDTRSNELLPPRWPSKLLAVLSDIDEQQNRKR